MVKRRRSVKAGRRVRRRTSAPYRKRGGYRTAYRRRGMPPLVHRFRRGLAGMNTVGTYTAWPTGTIASSSASIAGNAVNAPWLGAFRLNGIADIINNAEFTNLFDQYRIDKLVLRFYLKVDPGAQAAATANIPRLYIVRDRDDASPAANLNEMKENAMCKERVLSLYRPVTVVCRPNTLSLLWSTAVANNYRPTWGAWLDVGTPGSQHFCHKFAIDDLSNTNYRVDVEGTVYFSCRQAR